MAQVIQAGDLGQDQTLNQPGSQQQTQSGGNQPSQQAQAGQAPPITAQGNPTPTSGGGSAPATIGSNDISNPNKQQGSGYTNIQKVLQANQGNQLGSAVGNNLQNTETQAQQNLQNAQGQFNQQTQANQSNTQANQQLTQDVLANPTNYVGSNNPANSQGASQFQNLISGQYQGPTSLGNASQLQNQAANVAQQGQALGSSAGRMGLLQQIVGNPQYGTGQANLDSLLLGQSNDPSLQSAKRNALTLQGQVGSAVQGAAAQGQQQSAQSQQFGQALQNQLGQTVNQQTQALQQQASNAQQTNNQQYQKAISDLQSGNVSPQEAQLLGLTQGENVYNLLSGNNAAQYLQENPNQASVSNIATPQQYAQMQALQQLAGQYAPQSAQQSLQNFQNPSQAGSYAQQQNLIGNQSSFQNALANTQSNVNSVLNPAQNAQSQAQQMQNILLQNGVNPGTPSIQQSYNWQKAQQALQNAGFGSSLGGSEIQDVNWIANNLASQNAALAAAQQTIQNQYGTPETINVQQPSTANTLPVSNFPAIASATS